MVPAVAAVGVDSSNASPRYRPTDGVNGFGVNVAFNVMPRSITKVIVGLVELTLPLQLSKMYPRFGTAVTVYLWPATSIALLRFGAIVPLPSVVITIGVLPG